MTQGGFFVYLVAGMLASTCLGQCPVGTFVYPPSERSANPQSCYAFLTWRDVEFFWKKIWRYWFSPIKEGEDDTGHGRRALGGVVWDVDQARRMCREIGRLAYYNDTLAGSGLSFRLPIIDSANENFWLKEKMLEKETDMGHSFWIDLEVDPFFQEVYWASTGEAVTWQPPPATAEDQSWIDNKVDYDDPDAMVRICHVFHMNYKGLHLEGWHPRACAQAFNRYQGVEDCGILVIKCVEVSTDMFTGCPAVRQTIRSITAPVGVVCEAPLQPEPTAPPYRSPPAIPKGPRTKKPPKTTPVTSCSSMKRDAKWGCVILVIWWVINF